ncbi:MAG: hypothetical protein V4708_16365 [Bacteroidota bacterium]
MFETGYPVNKARVQQANNKKYLVSLSTYTFKTPKNRYIIEVEKYLHDIYILKFFPKHLQGNKKRFNVLTKEYCCSKIVSTCIEVVLSILRKHPTAHFGFMGAHIVDPSRQYEEPKNETKRWRVYKYAFECLIGPESFTHIMDKQNSTYLILNNQVPGHDELKEKADKMFIDLFPDLEGL